MLFGVYVEGPGRTMANPNTDKCSSRLAKRLAAKPERDLTTVSATGKFAPSA
jgi:hypothetical protein